MPVSRAELRRLEHEASIELERARAEYDAHARRRAIAAMVDLLAEEPSIGALHLRTEYEYDDEGGYFLVRYGRVTLRDTDADDEDAEDAWVECMEQLDREATVEVFGIGRDEVGQGSLTREQVEMLAAAENL